MDEGGDGDSDHDRQEVTMGGEAARNKEEWRRRWTGAS